jgi:hypothetical protein
MPQSGFEKVGIFGRQIAGIERLAAVERSKANAKKKSRARRVTTPLLRSS